MNQVSNGATSAGAGDMFLKIKGAKTGDINGEAQDSAHKNEIEVLGWSWGIHGKSDLATGAPSGRATVRELKIVKRVDKASTALLGATRSNEEIKEATLTLRKTGKTPLEFLKIKIESGRVVSVDIDAGDKGGSSTLVETITLSFNKITVDYTPQGPDGQPLGGTTYNDQWGESK